MRVCENCGQSIREGEACEQCKDLDRMVNSANEVEEDTQSTKSNSGGIIGLGIFVILFLTYILGMLTESMIILGLIILFFMYRIYEVVLSGASYNKIVGYLFFIIVAGILFYATFLINQNVS
jgi:uncharacterized membrane protein YvbJ